MPGHSFKHANVPKPFNKPKGKKNKNKKSKQFLKDIKEAIEGETHSLVQESIRLQGLEG